MKPGVVHFISCFLMDTVLRFTHGSKKTSEISPASLDDRVTKILVIKVPVVNLAYEGFCQFQKTDIFIFLCKNFDEMST